MSLPPRSALGKQPSSGGGAAGHSVFRLPGPLALLVSVAGGAGLALQGRINGELAVRMDDRIGAALISFATGLLLMLVFSLALPAGRAGLRRAASAWQERHYPRWYLLSGIAGAYYVFTQAVAVGVIGIALFMIAVVTGQTVSGLAADRIGMGPAGRRPISAWRATGAVLTLVGASVAVLPHFEASARAGALLLLVLLPLLAGLFQSFQQAMLGQMAAAYGTPITSTLFNFGVGTAALLVLWLVQTAVTRQAPLLPAEWWLYIGGPVGCLMMAVTTLSVASIGILLTGLAMIGGQLLGSLALDVFFPTAGSIVTAATALGLLLTLAAMVVATLPWPKRLLRPHSR